MNENIDRYDWADKAERENPAVFNEAMVKAFQAMRNPIVAIALARMSEKDRTACIQNCVKTVYDGLMAEVKKSKLRVVRNKE